RDYPATLSESRTRRRKHTATALERFEHSLLHVTGRLSSPHPRCELLHHHGAQERERKRSVEECEHLRLRFVASKAVDEDVRVESVLHAFCRRSNTSSTPPLRRTAANPLASSSRNATKSSAWSIASV